MDRTRRRARIVAALTASLGLLAAGCAARRELVIVSDPPGAAVRLDQQMVGVTPFETDFESFGTRRVTLYRQGYRAWSEPVELKAPWYARFPLDFFSEILLPFGWTYRKEVRVALEPESGSVTAPDLEGVLERAEVLRKAGPEGPRRQKPVEGPE